MPADFDRCVRDVTKQQMAKGKSQTDAQSSAFAICTTTFKKAGKKTSEDNKDWHILEFFAPIKESTTVDDKFFIRGMAINETTTRNGVTYIANELEKAAPSFRNKPILTDHESAVRNIVGRTTNNVNFNSTKKGIEFEAQIMDKQIKEMINDGRITDVSIGAIVEDLIENEKDNSVTAIGLEGLEISLVATPGDPGANIAMAMNESFNIKKEIMFNGQEPDPYINDLKGGNNMADEKQTEVENTEESQPEESKEDSEETKETEEKLKTAESKIAELEKVARGDAVRADTKVTESKKLKALDTSKMSTETIKALTEQVDEVEEPKEEESQPPVEDKTEESTEDKPVEDETKGTVGEEETEETQTEESLVIEKADTGKGFQIWRDYSKESAGKFKRLSR